MRRLPFLCIVSLSLTCGCGRANTPEGDGRTEAQSDTVSHPLDMPSSGADSVRLGGSTSRAARRDQEVRHRRPRWTCLCRKTGS